MIAQPLLALAVIWLAGLGPASVLARRLPRDAQIALAAPLSAALLACASVLVYFDVSAKLVAAVVLAGLSACTIVCARNLARRLRDYLAPALVAVVAISLAAGPFLREGDWGASTHGNMDPYLWVSQAKSLLEGAPPADGGGHPDRIPYELITDEQWATGLPFGVATLAWLSRSDPADVYGVFAVVLPALLALAVFFCARGGLLWGTRFAAFAGGLVGVNGYLLYGTFIGWQAQAALTTFGLLSVFCLWIALDRAALTRERVLAAVFAVAGIATYGWTYASFGGLLMAAVAGHLVVNRDLREWRRVGSVLAGFVVAVLAIGAVPIVQVVRALASAGTEWSTEVARWWRFFDPALPSDALGFVPRTPLIKQALPELGLLPVAIAAVVVSLVIAGGLLSRKSLQRRRGIAVLVAVLLFSFSALVLTIDITRGSLAVFIRMTPDEWSFLSAVVAAGVVASGLAGALSFRNQRADILVASTVFFLGALAILRISGTWPMYSIRLMGYAAPIFMLLALSPFVSGRARLPAGARAAGRILPLAAGAALLAIGMLTAAIQASNGLRTTDAAEEIAREAKVAAPRQPIEVNVEDGWNQAWLAYYLRDRDISLVRPSIYFTGFTRKATRTVLRGATAKYRIERNPRAKVAAGGDLLLNRVIPDPGRQRELRVSTRDASCRPCQGAA